MIDDLKAELHSIPQLCYSQCSQKYSPLLLSQYPSSVLYPLRLLGSSNRYEIMDHYLHDTNILHKPSSPVVLQTQSSGFIALPPVLARAWKDDNTGRMTGRCIYAAAQIVPLAAKQYPRKVLEDTINATSPSRTHSIFLVSRILRRDITIHFTLESIWHRLRAPTTSGN